MAVKTYNAADVIVIVGTSQMQGLAEGTFVEVSREVEAFTKQTGSDGEVTRSKTNNKSGTVTLTLQQGSASNDFHSALAKLDEESAAGVVPMSILEAETITVPHGVVPFQRVV